MLLIIQTFLCLSQDQARAQAELLRRQEELEKKAAELDRRERELQSHGVAGGRSDFHHSSPPYPYSCNCPCWSDLDSWKLIRVQVILQSATFCFSFDLRNFFALSWNIDTRGRQKLPLVFLLPVLFWRYFANNWKTTSYGKKKD